MTRDIVADDREGGLEEPWAAARGISLGVVLGLALWAAGILAVHALL